MHVPLAACDAFGSELPSAAEMAHNSIMVATWIGQAYLYDSWVAFTASLSQDPHLSHIPPSLHIDFFIIYTCRYGQGLLSHSSQPIRAKHMEEALHAVGQELSQLGLLDPHLDGIHYTF